MWLMTALRNATGRYADARREYLAPRRRGASRFRAAGPVAASPAPLTTAAMRAR